MAAWIGSQLAIAVEPRYCGIINGWLMDVPQALILIWEICSNYL